VPNVHAECDQDDRGDDDGRGARAHDAQAFLTASAVRSIGRRRSATPVAA